MRILIFGGSGMLGHKLVQSWKDSFEVWTTLREGFEKYKKLEIFDSRKTIDFVDAERFETCENAVKFVRPDVIVNAIGIIKQLPSSKDVIHTISVNTIFPHKLAEIAAKIGARLITISTDCVFDGKKGNYTEEDVSNATDVYGKSKNLGEVVGQNCLTLRTSIIGRELQTWHSLVDWFLSNRGKTVKGYKNAVYSGFPTVILADIIGNLLVNYKDLQGLYHVSSDPINKYDLLTLIKEYYRADVEIEAFEDFRIDRSLDSTKFRKVTGFSPLSWREMIERMANDPTPYDDWKKIMRINV